MTDPIRWCDEAGNADELEREVLRSDHGMEPTASASAVVWGKLAGELGLATAVIGVASAEAVRHGVSAASGTKGVGTAALTNASSLVPAAGGSLAFIKGVAVGVLGCCALWGGSKLLGDRAQVHELGAPRAVALASVGSSKPAPDARVVQSTHLEPPVAKATPLPANGQQPALQPARPAAVTPIGEGVPSPSVATFSESNEAPSAAPPTSELGQEALLLRRARERLRAGELGAASELLNESKRRFAAPKLYQEREALQIELLFRSGQTAVAAERARVFLSTFPESPHASRVRAFTAP